MESYEDLMMMNSKYKFQRDFWIDFLNHLDNDYMNKLKVVSTPYSEAEDIRKKMTIVLEDEISEKIAKISKGSDISIYIFLLSTFVITMNKYFNRDDVYVGLPGYREDSKNLDSEIMILRQVMKKEKTFKELLMSVKSSYLKICDNQDYPFEKILEEMNLSSDIANNIIVASENIHATDKLEMKKGNNLVFVINHTNQAIELKIFYNNAQFSANEIEHISNSFKNVVTSIIKNFDITMREISILSDSEKEKILFDLNDTSFVYDKDLTISQLFEEQVYKYPNRIAVAYEEETITYKELNRKANRLARILREKGIVKDNIVGLMVDRSIDMIIGMLGIIKAGGAYLPIDNNLPQAIIISMLNDADIKIILSKSNVIDTQSFITLQGLNVTELEPHRTPVRAPIAELDELPLINRSLVDYEKYNRHIGLTMVKSGITLQATRGCPYNCSYCHKIWSKKHIVRSAEHIFSEVKLYYDMSVRRFSFIDDIFNLDIENSSRFFRYIIDNNMKVQIFFPAGLRGDILTKDYIDLMVKAGTVNIALALETSSYRLQKLIHKNLNIDRLFENLKYISETYPHVITELFTMHGFPTETKEEALSTLEFIKKLKWIHFPYVHILKIYNNTEMEKLALENGITQDAINRSMELAWHELPETLPFDKEFTKQYQGEFLDEYFMRKERLIAVLPHQMRIMTESELVEKYRSYLPIDIHSLDDLLSFTGITPEELGDCKCLEESSLIIENLNEKMKKHFKRPEPNKDALRVLLLDLSQYFEGEANSHYDPIEPPLGHMYLLSYLEYKLGKKINGNIAKSRVDFSSYDGLKKLLDDFKPDVIGIRSLNYFRNFFHKTVSIIRGWDIDVPIIAGGPYGTSMCDEVLRDRNVDIVSIGEGEYTFLQIINKIIEANGKLPEEEVLNKIEGIAYIPKEKLKENNYAREILMLDMLDNQETSEKDDEWTDRNQPSDLAYSIFTSGSTGNPKGILVEHKNVINLAFGLRERVYHRYQENLNVALVAHYVFDASVQQIFGSLLLGNTLFITPDDVRGSGESLIQYYIKNKIDISDGTPAHLALMLEDHKEGLLEIPVKHFIIGGEALPLAIVRRFLHLFKNTAPLVTNVYGPTECCVDSSSFELSIDTIDDMDDMPIGYPMPNEKIFIFNKDMQLQPCGVEGEICISGEGVTRGYLKRDDLTHQKFIQNPLIQQERLYLTGDIGKWGEDGKLYYTKRKDNQVKIRGYRIELGEIKYQLLRHPNIIEAEVIVCGEEENSNLSDKYICAYCVEDKELEPSEIRLFLLHYLPTYMVPKYFIALSRMPKTSSGKIDKKSLPNPKAYMQKSTYQLHEPTNEIEKKLVECYKQVLGREKLSINENFFTIGGDSIKTIQIVSRMKKDGYKIDMNDIFEHPTIEELAPYVKEIQHICDQSMVQGEVQLTPIQKEFLYEENKGKHYFNQSMMLYSSKNLSDELVKEIFGKIQEHHDSLRMTFESRDGRMIQTCKGADELEVSLKTYSLEQDNDAINMMRTRCNEIQGSINLEKGPLIKLGLFHLNDGDRLLVAVHHLVMDGISWRVLLEDINTLYNRYMNGEKLTLPLKTDSYKVWVEKLSEYSRTKQLLDEKQYWISVVEEIRRIPMITKDYDGNNYVKDRQVLSVSLDREETDNLLNKVSHAFGTEINDILLTALIISNHKTFGNSKMLIELEGHGREQIVNNMDISRTIGWFTSLFPVILEMEENDDLAHHIKKQKEVLRKIPRKGIGFNILKYLAEDQEELNTKLMYKPQMCYNYLGQFNNEIENNIFELAKEDTGDYEGGDRSSKYELAINSNIFYGKLEIKMSYSKLQYSDSTIMAFLDNYKQSLRNIISLCMERKEKELSPSDLGYKDIEIDQLENFFD